MQELACKLYQEYDVQAITLAGRDAAHITIVRVLAGSGNRYQMTSMVRADTGFSQEFLPQKLWLLIGVVLSTISFFRFIWHVHGYPSRLPLTCQITAT